MAKDKLLGHGLTDLEVTSSSGKCVFDETKQLKGEASKDSLFGTNSTVEYATDQKLENVGGKPGGMPHFN